MKVKLALLLTLIGTLPLAAQNVRQEQDTVSYMNDDPFNLEQIVVTATRTEKKIKNTPVITQIITSKQIEERGTGNIQDLLTQEVPGLNFQEVGYGTSIDIQGLGSKHILFLIDGERIAGENGGNIDYSRINLYNIDHIEIVKELLRPSMVLKRWAELSTSLRVKPKRNSRLPQAYAMQEETSKTIKILPKIIRNTNIGFIWINPI